MRKRAPNKGSKPKFWIRLPSIILILLLSLLFIRIKTTFSGINKVSLVAVTKNEVRIEIYDFGKKTISRMIIPGNTSLEASRDLGIWKLGSLMELGKNEKAGGNILRETINRSLKIPVLYWREGGSSNLNFFEVLRLWFFKRTVSQVNIFDYDLVSLGYLLEKKYPEGGTYFETFAQVPASLLPVISEFSLPVKVSLNDFGGSPKLKSFVALIENTGAKVVFIKKAPSQEIGCRIEAGDFYAGKYFRALLEKCSFKLDRGMKKDELTLSIGSDFVKRF